MINSILYRPSSTLQIHAVQRYYSRRYNSIFGNAFGESSQVKNENGIYIGAVYQPLSQLRATVYADFCDFPFYRYLVSFTHSKSFEALGQLEYTTN